MTVAVAAAVRRVVIYKAADGWRFKAQSANWSTLEASKRGTPRRGDLRRRLERRFPDAEIVER